MEYGPILIVILYFNFQRYAYERVLDLVADTVCVLEVVCVLDGVVDGVVEDV